MDRNNLRNQCNGNSGTDIEGYSIWIGIMYSRGRGLESSIRLTVCSYRLVGMYVDLGD